MGNNDRIEVMYNGCYGGFKLSQEAVDLYAEEKRKLGCSVTDHDIQFEIPRGVSRYDEMMINIVKKLGERASCKTSKIMIASSPAKYKNHILFGEYDGYESAHLESGYGNV